MKSEIFVKATKFIVNTCVNRTVVEGLDNLTRTYGDSRARKVVKFIGREGIGLVVTSVTKKVIDEAIDEFADKVADIIIEIRSAKEEKE